MSLIANITPIDFDLTNMNYHSIINDYAKHALHHNIMHYEEGGSFNGHLMYAHLFNIFSNSQEREIYKNLSKAWQKNAIEIHIYGDMGINHEMLDHAIQLNTERPDTPIYLVSLKDSKKEAISIDELKLLHKKLLETNNGSLNIKSDILDLYPIPYKDKPHQHQHSEINYGDMDLHFSDYDTAIFESRFAGVDRQDVENNLIYMYESMRVLAKQGIAVSASHNAITQCLDDTKKADRDQGIEEGLMIAAGANTVCSLDRGISRGMMYGLERAILEKRKIFYFSLSDNQTTQDTIKNITSVEDALKFVDDQRKINSELYSNTGYCIDTPLSQKMIKKLAENPSKLRGLDRS